MKGYLWNKAEAPPDAEAERLEQWEAVAVDAVGNVIEFWGFKRNQGRVWALLYLRDTALTAAEIESELELSKGGVSMLLRDLERWGVILRVRSPSDASWRYRAETDLLKEMTAEYIADRRRRIPMNRFCTVAEIAEMTAFVASPACSFTTGFVFDISGGRATY